MADSPVPPEEITGGCFPYGFKREFKALFHLAWPTSLSILFHQTLQPISLAFCGHLGETELAAVAISISVIYITTVSVSRGLAFGGDTFFAQTYGSANKKKMGVYLQKAILFGFLVTFFTVGLLLNTENMLLLARQPPDVARLAQSYCVLFSPGALAYMWLFTLMRYLLCQNRVIPNLVICVVSCGICAILNYGLIYQAKMGIAGSAIALALTYYLVLIQLVGYIWVSGIYRETWDGWSWDCLLDWWPFTKVIVASISMTFLFWFYTEIGTFLAGLLSQNAISAFSIHFQVEGFAWMIPIGLGGACTVRIGQYLGANDPNGAVTACRVTLLIQVVTSILLAVPVYFLRNYLPQIFTDKTGVIEYTASIMPLVALFVLLEGVGGVGVSIARGIGRQTLGAVILFFSGYVFSLPIGIPLMFLTKMGLSGLWWGYNVGLAVEDLFLLIFIARLDWMNEAQKAQIRIGMIEAPEAINRPIDISTSAEHQDDETAPLLPGNSPQHSLHDDVRWSRVITSRVLIFLACASFLAGAYVIQLYVHVPVAWQLLCVTSNNTMRISANSEISGTVLPFCNETVHFPVEEMFFVANTRL